MWRKTPGGILAVMIIGVFVTAGCDNNGSSCAVGTSNTATTTLQLRWHVDVLNFSDTCTDMNVKWTVSPTSLTGASGISTTQSNGQGHLYATTPGTFGNNTCGPGFNEPCKACVYGDTVGGLKAGKWRIHIEWLAPATTPSTAVTVNWAADCDASLMPGPRIADFIVSNAGCQVQ
jgi:hypothetical protein